jgi:predicted dehydrogenase
MSKIKFAVVGCGHIGKRHASMILGNSDFELIALCDIKKKENLGLENFSDVKFFNSLEALIESNLEIDAVAIASPNGFQIGRAHV